jgi:hypothetical protein
MNSFPAPTIDAAAVTAQCILQPSAACERRQSDGSPVGDVLRDPIREVEDELDDLIRDLQTLAALAQDRGDIQTAFEYTRRMLAASRSRTREHKDRLAREHLAMVEASLDNGAAYFAAEGDKARVRRLAG